VEWRKALTHPGLRRLPLIAVAAVGIWMWQGGPKDREFYWQLPADRAAIEQVKIQLRDESGTVLKGDELYYDHRGAPPEVRTQARLPDGTYQAQVTLRRRGGAEESIQRPVDVRGEVTSVRLW
jgi:hypothetical protein